MGGEKTGLAEANALTYGLLPARNSIRVDIDRGEVVIPGHRAPCGQELASKVIDVDEHEGMSKPGAEASGEALAFHEGALVVGVATGHPRVRDDLDDADAPTGELTRMGEDAWEELGYYATGALLILAIGKLGEDRV